MSGMDLVEFLNARLDEDEQVARDAAVDSGGVWQAGPSVWGDLDEVFPVVYDEGRPTADQAAHIARHDPARVLADVEAKRRLIERYIRAVAATPSVSSYVRGQDDGYRQACLDAIRDAVEIHADHPDYREEWRP